MSTARDIAHWLATTARKGPVELATQAEVDAGTDTDRAITPATLKSTQLPGCLISEEVFTANGTWTKPTGCKRVEVTVVGAGGGSAGAQCTVSPEYRVSGAGGGGGCMYAVFEASDLGATVTVAVGTGGAAGASGNNNGSGGGYSSFNGTSGSAYVFSYGGDGGTSAAADNFGIGGRSYTGLAATPGDGYNIGYRGTKGNGGTLSGSYCRMQGGCAGGPVSAPGRNTPGVAGSSYAAPGLAPGTARYGGGATGAAIRDSISSVAGAAGTDGIVIVRAYG